MNIQPGQPAPDFTLVDSDKNKVTLSDLRGHNVVLLFFPFAFSSVCTKELCSVRDSFAIYDQLEAKVFGISVDSHYALRRFKQDQNLNFTLLSDFNKEASTAYNTIYPEFGLGMKGVSKRSAFVIDKNGIIRYSEVLDNPGIVPDFGKIAETLKASS